MRRLLDWDADTLTATYHHYDHDTGLTTIEEVQDIEPIIELNKAKQNHGQGGAKGINEYSKQGIKNEWWHVATIPNSVLMRWRTEYGLNIHLWGRCEWTTRKIKQLLNSREWALLRTGTGRI